MKRAFTPGRRDYDDGIARLYACTGSCYRRPGWCDCKTAETELSCDIAPDAERVIKAPVRTPEDTAAIARARRWAVVIALASMAFLALLLKLAGARSIQ